MQRVGVLIPTAYAKSKGLPYTRTFKYPTRWCSDSVVKILEKSEYIGHTVNFRTRQKSRKNKKKIKNSRVEWVIFENTHEAIVLQYDLNLCRKYKKQNSPAEIKGDKSIFKHSVLCGLRKQASSLSFQKPYF